MHSNLNQAALGVFENRVDLFASYAGKPLQEIIHARPILEIFEECLHGHTRTFE